MNNEDYSLCRDNGFCYAITDAMCAEHDWLTAGAASYKFAFDKISENFVEIYIKILDFGKLVNN